MSLTDDDLQRLSDLHDRCDRKGMDYTVMRCRRKSSEFPYNFVIEVTPDDGRDLVASGHGDTLSEAVRSAIEQTPNRKHG